MDIEDVWRKYQDLGGGGDDVDKSAFFKIIGILLLRANKEPVANVLLQRGVIKPCPFCGGALYLRELDEPNAYFGCKSCDVDITLSGVYDESEAIEAIDRRAI